MKIWIEYFFDVKVIVMNSYCFFEKGGKRGLMIGYLICCKCMIIIFKFGDFILFFLE